MKTLLRIGMILLAALIVTGVFYGLSQTSVGQSLFSGGGEGRGRGGEGFELAEGGEAAGDFAGRPERGQGESFRGGEGRGERDGRGGLPTETIGHLIAISLITALVVVLTWLSDKIRSMLRRKAAPGVS